MSRWAAPASAAEADTVFGFRALGGPCSIQLPAALVTPEAHRAVQVAIAEVRRIEHKYSRYRADSWLSRLNAAAGSDTWLDADDETAHLLDFADQAFQASGGLFDISTGVLGQAWDFQRGTVPTAAELAPLRARVGWQRVQWQRPRLRLPEPGMALDFGGFGKEYAADRAATLLHEAGVSAALVNLGGDMRLLGPRPDGRPWVLGIAHPRQAGAVLARVELHTGALATSGDYERFFERDGQRYCHVLDPRTGWPVQHWRSVSVLAPGCLAAGVLSTIAMLSGEQAPAFLQAQGLDFLCVDQQGRCTDEAGPWHPSTDGG